jgi:hypothetical protein
MNAGGEHGTELTPEQNRSNKGRSWVAISRNVALSE